MTRYPLPRLFFLVIGAVSFTANGVQAEPTPGYNTSIPPAVTTPDKVRTRIGTLRFEDGMPTARTVELAYENLDFLRGVEVFLNFIPMASLEALRIGHEELGVTQSNQVLIAEDLMDSTPLFLTGNTDTVYASVFMDLQRDGPMVVEVPPKAGPGTVNDAFFRFVIDMGAPGPDRGQGGKYLILPPDYDGDVPEGYFVAQSSSYINWLILRGLLVDGKTDAPVQMWRSGLKVYPLADRDAPPSMEFTNLSGQDFNTIHANDFTFYKELEPVLNREPVAMIDPELRGLAASIGLQKGKPFAPDEKLRKTLDEAVAVGNASARAMMFRPRDPSAYVYGPDKGWVTPFIGGSHEWLIDGGAGGRNLDARTMFFYGATVNTPAMTLKMVGVGSQYAYNFTDSNSKYLSGKNTYRLTLPANIPARDFWSIVVYDPQTRSELQTGQPYPSKNSVRDKEMVYNDDGSIDLYFGPKAPAGKEANWIETVPGKGWMTLIRLYGPLESWFDKTWQPGEFELMR